VGWFEERAGLAGTVAVVTGGAGGLGSAITTDLAANGVRVAVVDIDAEALESLRGSLGAADVILQHGDARDPEVLQELFQASDARWGRLDTLVNVVGGTFRADFVNTTPKGWDTLLRTNLMHVLHACALAIPRMQAGGRGGSIINMTTIEAHRAAPGYAIYSAAKAGVEQFARTLSVELAPSGIRVNNVAPDYTPTPNILKMSGGAGIAREEAAMKVNIPMGRAGVLTDVSGVVVFLASGLSSYITGTTLHPDGGTYASSGWYNWPGTGFNNMLPTPVLDYLSSVAPDG
jgi:NAD(P)-dependent dehydrogenase (short-subunit alcohol dehydrogenase family)